MDHSQHMGMASGMTHGSQYSVGLLFSLLAFVGIGLFFYRIKYFETRTRRINLFKISFLERMVKSKYFIFSVRFIPASLFLFVLATGFWGSARGNFAAPFTWLFWWTLLIFFIAFGGKIFCMACPWDFFSNLFQFAWFHKRTRSVSGFGLKWPKALSNIYMASVFFIIFTWLELVGVATNSFVTALLGLLFVCAAILMALVFRDRPFCRFLCPIGRISGIYAQLSPLEIRPNDLSVCSTCKTKECVKGTPTSTRCPTGEIPFKLQENTFCTLCTECIRSCDKGNMVFKLRPLATDLLNSKRMHKDELLLIVLILVLTFFHGLTMTPLWFQWMESIQGMFSISYMVAFSLVMPALLVISFFSFYLFVKLVGTSKGLTALIPLALGYHLGHNLMHLLNESLNLFSYANDPFGWGWNIFNIKNFKATPLLSHSHSQILQFICVVVGFYYSIKVISVRLKEQFLVHYALVFGVALLGLWLISQPMVMRTAHG